MEDWLKFLFADKIWVYPLFKSFFFLFFVFSFSFSFFFFSFSYFSLYFYFSFLSSFFFFHFLYSFLFSLFSKIFLFIDFQGSIVGVVLTNKKSANIIFSNPKLRLIIVKFINKIRKSSVIIWYFGFDASGSTTSQNMKNHRTFIPWGEVISFFLSFFYHILEFFETLIILVLSYFWPYEFFIIFWIS